MSDAETPKRGRGKSAGGLDAIPEISLAAKALKLALKGVGDVVEARNTIPILANLLIRAQHGRATLSATDLDLWLVHGCTVEQEADAPAFVTTVSAKLLASIVGKIDGDATITLQLHPGKIIATAGRARFTLPTLPAEDFPESVARDFPHRFELAAFDLAAMLGTIRHAICTEETRYYLNGVYLHAAENRGPTGDGEGTLLVLRGVTTDGHRLARFDVAQPDGAGALNGVIVPAKAVGVIEKLCDGYEGPVEIGVDDRTLTADFGDITLTTKLIDGTFPDYTRVIPRGNDKIVAVDSGTLAEAVGRVMLMADGKSRAVKCSFARDIVTLSSQSAELGQASEEVPCDYDGGEVTVGFNGKYMLDVLARIQSGSCEWHLADAAAPVLIRDSNVEARGLFVLMPTRV